MKNRPETRKPLDKKTRALEDILSEPTVEEKRTPPQAATLDEVRATFIVDSEKLQLLKDYAYIERMQIKEVVNQMLTEFLTAHFDNSKAINNNTWKGGKEKGE